ncbi:hypothetical protein ACEZ3G_05415 [Maribacter algicola]|uniref:Uncharacterized protein n=1 Tax=Meishania litoralis TaxID=3434685 RepID=A0ACC7LI55_9FLAO
MKSKLNQKSKLKISLCINGMEYCVNGFQMAIPKAWKSTNTAYQNLLAILGYFHTNRT